MKIKIKKKKEVLDEMSSMTGGSVEGYGGTFGDDKTVDAFNKKQEREQRLKGHKLTEMYSSRGISGRNAQQLVSGEEEHEAHVERSEAQGLKNVMQEEEGNIKVEETKKYWSKFLLNPQKNDIIK
tara:strand:+ start:3347 stop:3721 length:375 start_codon:yes stop_codon:yes gene_type:complete